MENLSRIPTKIMEIEICIKLLEFLKRKNTIDDEMYNFGINKLIGKLKLEKLKQDDDDYKVLI